MFTPKRQKVKRDQFKKQKKRKAPQTMRNKRNNPQSKGKEEPSEIILNEIESSRLPGIQFKK